MANVCKHLATFCGTLFSFQEVCSIQIHFWKGYCSFEILVILYFQMNGTLSEIQLHFQFVFISKFQILNSNYLLNSNSYQVFTICPISTSDTVKGTATDVTVVALRHILLLCALPKRWDTPYSCDLWSVCVYVLCLWSPGTN